MKKNYFKPAMRVVELKYNGIICQSLRSAPNNADINDEIQSDAGSDGIIR